jgi:Bifunctional DNA primase/polymerase, N-terminal
VTLNHSRVTTASPLLQARRYAQQNWPVFPCQDKKPLTTNGFDDATTDLDRVRSWWQRWPDASIGVVCGPQLTVLDVDSPTGQRELWSLAQQTGLDLGHVPQARTPKGCHYWFAGNGLPPLLSQSGTSRRRSRSRSLA